MMFALCSHLLNCSTATARTNTFRLGCQHTMAGGTCAHLPSTSLPAAAPPLSVSMAQYSGRAGSSCPPVGCPQVALGTCPRPCPPRSAPPTPRSGLVVRLLCGSTEAAEMAMRVKARSIALPLGAAAGAFGGLVGVGGGVLIAPVIVNACKTIPQRVVAGTSLAAVAATGAVAGTVYWMGGAVDVEAAAYVSASALLAAPVGALATTKLNCQMLRRLLGYWLYAVPPLIPLKAWLFTQPSPGPSSDPANTPDAPTSNLAGPAATGAGAPDSAATAADPPVMRDTEGHEGHVRPDTAALLLATGVVAGLASGLLGIGGGTIVTPLLAISTDMNHTQVLGTSLAAMLLPSLVGLAKHHRLGNVDWPMAARLAAGTALGGWVGSKLALEAPPGVLEAGFAVAMLVLGNRTLAGVKAAAAKGAKRQ